MKGQNKKFKMNAFNITVIEQADLVVVPSNLSTNSGSIMIGSMKSRFELGPYIQHFFMTRKLDCSLNQLLLSVKRTGR